MTRIFLRNIDPLVVILEHSCIHTDSKKKFFFVTLKWIYFMVEEKSLINVQVEWKFHVAISLRSMLATQERACVCVCVRTTTLRYYGGNNGLKNGEKIFLRRFCFSFSFSFFQHLFLFLSSTRLLDYIYS